MKRLLASIAIAITLLTAPAMLTGCKTTDSPQVLALKSLETTWQAVHAARVVYAKAYRAGKIDDVTHTKALAADKQFRLAFGEALDAAALDWTQITPANVTSAAEAFLNIVTIATTRD